MLYIAGDKHGYKVIDIVSEYLREKDIEFENLGVRNSTEDVELQDMIPKVTKKVLEHADNLGILTCGTGVGVEVGANKFSGIRACLATNAKIAQWSKVYDNCNVLCLVGWETNKEELLKILESWFSSQYDGDEDRLKMIDEFNTWH